VSVGGRQRSIGEWNRHLARPTIWLGSEKWGVRGDGITEPFSVYSLDATRTPFGFLPFGLALPGMMEQQAHALCNLLNEMQETSKR